MAGGGGGGGGGCGRGRYLQIFLGVWLIYRIFFGMADILYIFRG